MSDGYYIKRGSLELTQPISNHSPNLTIRLLRPHLWPSCRFPSQRELFIRHLRSLQMKILTSVAWTDAIVRTCTVQRHITLRRLKGRLGVPTVNPGPCGRVRCEKRYAAHVRRYMTRTHSCVLRSNLFAAFHDQVCSLAVHNSKRNHGWLLIQSETQIVTKLGY